MNETKHINELQLKVLRLYDEFALFSRQCAFLCDAFAAVPSHHETLTPTTLDGLDHYAHWLKTRMIEIQTELGQVHEQLQALNPV